MWRAARRSDHLARIQASPHRRAVECIHDKILGNTFNATSRFSRVSRARNTSPMPPVPMLAVAPYWLNVLLAYFAQRSLRILLIGCSTKISLLTELQPRDDPATFRSHHHFLNVA